MRALLSILGLSDNAKRTSQVEAGVVRTSPHGISSLTYADAMLSAIG